MVKDVKAKSQVKQNKNEINNSKLFKEVITSLHNIVKRRTSTNYSIMIINDVLKNLRDRFDFLKNVDVLPNRHADDEDGLIMIDDKLDSIKPEEIGKAVESLIRLISMNMKDKDAGLYFITELKENISSRYISKLKILGVDIDLIQQEQHYLYKQRKMKVALPESYQKPKSKKEKLSTFASLINFSWDKVAFWEYQDNICTVYDKKGNILDKLPLDSIVREYIVEMTGFEELPLNSEKIVELNEKEYEFVKLLYSKDLDAEEAMNLLNLSREELSIIIRKLLVYEILQYISYDEIMLTDNGIKKLLKKV
jgi:hypothetical protein